MCACKCVFVCVYELKQITNKQNGVFTLVFAYMCLCLDVCRCVFVGLRMYLCVFALCMCLRMFADLQQTLLLGRPSSWLALGVFIRNSWHSLLIGSQHEYPGLYLWPASSSIQSDWITLDHLPASSDFKLNLQEHPAPLCLLALVHIAIAFWCTYNMKS